MDLIQFGTAKSLDNNRKQKNKIKKQINKKKSNFGDYSTFECTAHTTKKRNIMHFWEKKKVHGKKIGDLILKKKTYIYDSSKQLKSNAHTILSAQFTSTK